MTVPKALGAKYEVLSGDVNWRDYGCTWKRELESGFFEIIEFINLEWASEPIEGNKYYVLRTYIEIDHTDEHQKGIVERMIKNGIQVSEESILDEMMSEGCYDTDRWILGNNAHKMLRDIK